MTKRYLGILLLFFGLGSAQAGTIMFEGYYRFEHDGKPIGYSILRYEFDPNTQVFESKSFVRAKLGDQVIQESIVAKSTNKFKPIAYQYTSQVGEEFSAIDATFKGEVMTVTYTNKQKPRTETSRIPKGTFLSSFLPYLLLQRDLKVGSNFKYSAVAEEDGASYNGKAMLESKDVSSGYVTFNILNRFKNEEFVSKMGIIQDPQTGKSVRGEVFSTNSPSKKLTTRLVASASIATEGQVVPNTTLLKIFGTIPTGKINLVATPNNTAAPTSKAPDFIPPTTPVEIKPTTPKKTGP